MIPTAASPPITPPAIAPALVPPPPDELSSESDELLVDVLTHCIVAHSVQDWAVITHFVPDGQSHEGDSCGHCLHSARANKAAFC